jgi:hypothetical protein
VKRLELFDSSLDTSEGSALWAQVIEPTFELLGTDPFDTDIRAFLKDRITQAFPLVSAQDGDALVDLLITPLEVLLEPLKREIQIIRKGQSARYPENLRLEDARDLAANFFIEWRSGTRSSGVVRVYFAAPTFLTVLPTAEFSTAGGLLFYPTRAVSVRPETMLLYRSGQEFYADIPVVSAESTTGHNITKGSITGVRGITGFTRLANLNAFAGGTDPETAVELLSRVQASLAERTLNVRRGIVARLETDFTSIVDVEVVGYGDPEMMRDIITGGGEGSVIASGVCFIVGQFVLMFSTFEDRGSDGTGAIAEGDEIELNFWSFLYSTEAGAANEKFKIDTILFDSRNSITQMPSILLFRIDNVPSVTAPIAGTLPGVLPGVFAVVRSTGKIEISDIPGGILSPDTLRGTIEINDNEVHVGGHYDVWLRASSATTDSATHETVRSETALLEGTDVVLAGESTTYRHIVHRTYTVSSSTSFLLGQTLFCSTSKAAAVIAEVSREGAVYSYVLWEMNGTAFEVSDSVTDGILTGTLSAVDSSDWKDTGVERGMVLSIPVGNEEGSYRILKVDGPFLYIDINLTTTARDQTFRVLSGVAIDLFSPKTPLIPFGEAKGDDLRSVIGSKTLRFGINLQDYGVAVGDTIEILDGDDVGTYPISSWDTTYGGYGAVVGSAMTATNSSVAYRVYRPQTAIQRPLLRLVPDGVVLLDGDGQDSGYKIPNAIPVDVRPVHAFSGAKARAEGLNGFVLMDPGTGWAPTADYTVDIETTDWSGLTSDVSGITDEEAFTAFYSAEKFRRAYTDEALSSAGGYIAVISVYGSDTQMYLDSNLPSAVTDFLGSLQTWLLDIIAAFGFGGDETALVTAFSPIKFGPNADTAPALLMQFEILIPYEVFDGCNNVFVALPEFDWKNEFEATDTFNDAIGRFDDGTMPGKAPALAKAVAGDALTITSGLNAGSYLIESVQTYALVNARALVDGNIDLASAYQVALVVIRDEFPVPAFYGLDEFFKSGPAAWSMPAVADLPFTVVDEDGVAVDGWVWVEKALEWFFKTLNALGFDLPSGVSLDVPETLKAFWEMLFSSYTVGRPTAPQYLRMYFQEPTSCTVYAPRVCARYQWAPPVLTPAEAIEGVELTLPLADLETLVVSLEVERLTGSTTLSGTLTADFGTAATLEDLAALLQALLDPTEIYVTFSGPATTTGALSITQVAGGIDEYLYLSAISLTAGFRVLGFYGPSPEKFPEVDTTTTCTTMYEQITTTSDALGMDITIDTTLTLVTPVAQFVGSFIIGETVTALPSGASGKVWAFADDTTDTFSGKLWIADVSGTFAIADTVTGSNSLAEIVGTNTADANQVLAVISLTDGVTATSRTFEEVAAALQAATVAAFESIVAGGSPGDFDDIQISTNFSATIEFVDQSGTGAGPGRYEITIEDPGYPPLVAGFTVTTPTDAGLDDFAIGYVNSVLPAVSTGTLLEGMDYTPTVTVPEMFTDDGVTTVMLSPTLTYWEALTFKTEVCDLIDSGDYEGAAQALNAKEDWTQSSGVRHLFWSDTGSALRLRGIVGGVDSVVSIMDADRLGFPIPGGISLPVASGAGTSAVSWTAQGTTVAGDLVAVFEHPHAPTLFVGSVGAEEQLFTPSGEADPYEVFPGQTDAGDTATVDLPRDIVIGTPYSGQLSVECVFTDDTYAAPTELDIREESDFLFVYEQRRTLEHTDYTATDTDISGDRVVAVVTSFGSNQVSLLDMGESNEFTFIAPNSGLEYDQVQVGDVLFIEEGDDLGGYTVLERSATILTLDRNLTASTERVYRYGNDGILIVDVSGAKVTSATGLFTSDDIGRYLTLWGSNRENTDGAFKITAVEADGSGCTVEADVFPETETDVHWAVVKAPVDALGDSTILGRTALLGVRPVRIYSGTPAECRVVSVPPTLERAAGTVFAALTVDGAVPRSGVKQPYKFVRPGTQHISSTRMNTQRDRGFFYFDVLATSMGGSDLYNIPEYTKVEPVFGTYDSYGYRIDVSDSRYTFSTQEEATLLMSPVFLPVGLDDALSNLVTISDQSIRFDYEYVPEVAAVQNLLSSEIDRVLCANALARHFLPAYVSVDILYTGGNSPSTIATALQDNINAMSAVDELDLSKLEKILHQNAVTSYEHPIRLTTLTHDLDRRIVGTQSEGVINDDNIAYNGTNRTTFFIAGDDVSSVVEDEDVPAGPRIRLKRGTPSSTFR